MNYWWCNQTSGWAEEYAAGVVCSSTETPKPKFREMVGQAKGGDIVLHYRSGRGIVAVSRAKQDPIRCTGQDDPPICIYGKGWALPTDYAVFRKPVPRDLFIHLLRHLGEKYAPIITHEDGRTTVRQSFFMAFSDEGLRIVHGAAPGWDWPDWLLDHLASPESPDASGHPEALADPLTQAVEGLAAEVRSLVRRRDRRLRDEAFRRGGGKCAACHRDFNDLLDGRGTRALHVHHINQLAAREAPAITHVDELVVVCATCHALIHADPECALSVDHLRKELQGKGYLVS